jgi:hypothetical protein
MLFGSFFRLRKTSLISRAFRVSARIPPKYAVFGPHFSDGLCVLAVFLTYAAHAVFVAPNYDHFSVGQLLSGSAFSVAMGALIGFALFDRCGRGRVRLFIGGTIVLILAAALFNETVVEPYVFDDGPLNTEGLYYSVTDICTTAIIFLVLRLVKLLRRPGAADAIPGFSESGEADCFFVRIASQTRRIFASDVLYMKAERDFTRIVCASGSYFVSESLKDLLEKSSVLGMTRAHKSFAVNLRRVDRLTGTEAEVGGRYVPVGRTFRAGLAAAWIGETGSRRRPAIFCG